MIGLPQEFLHESGVGGGVLQVSVIIISQFGFD